MTLNTWAYAAFALSFVVSLVYLAQDRMLRSHRAGAVFWRSPALSVLDRMARSSVYVGLATLGVGVASGLIWEHRLTGAYALGDPKVSSPSELSRSTFCIWRFRATRDGAAPGLP